jgi:hypothetical protein
MTWSTALALVVALAGPVLPLEDAGRWMPLLSPLKSEWARVTYYGPHYGDGQHYCNDGTLYTDDGWFVALGPSMLSQARALSGERWPTVRLTRRDGKSFTLPVRDTGASAHGYELEVDLPGDGETGTWAIVSGLDWSEGVFEARVDVLAMNAEVEMEQPEPYQVKKRVAPQPGDRMTFWPLRQEATFDRAVWQNGRLTYVCHVTVGGKRQMLAGDVSLWSPVEEVAP